MQIQFNLFALKRQLELHTGRPYSWKEIAVETGIHRNTLNNLATNSTRRLDLDILAALLSYFRRQGMPITVGDLFTVTE